MKNLDDIFLRDSRNDGQALVGLDGHIRSMTLMDHYESIAGLRLAGDAPTRVVELYEDARDLFLYSWFAYRFVAISILQVHAAVELALQDKAGIDGVKKIPNGIKRLLWMAIDRQWLMDSGFPSLKRRRSDPVFRDIPGMLLRSDDAQAYCKELIAAMASIRNDLAHGSDSLYDPGFGLTALEVCGEIIDQLFPRKSI